MSTPGNSHPAVGNFEQPVLEIVNPETFRSVRSAIETCFSQAKVADFLKSLSRAGLRIRSFEDVLAPGLFGSNVKPQYQSLTNGDQGQIREFYLATLEKIDPALRQRFFKLYAYY